MVKRGPFHGSLRGYRNLFWNLVELFKSADLSINSLQYILTGPKESHSSEELPLTLSQVSTLTREYTRGKNLFGHSEPFCIHSRHSHPFLTHSNLFSIHYLCISSHSQGILIHFKPFAAIRSHFESFKCP
jgi:hypothetical protein